MGEGIDRAKKGEGKERAHLCRLGGGDCFLRRHDLCLCFPFPPLHTTARAPSPSSFSLFRLPPVIAAASVEEQPHVLADPGRRGGAPRQAPGVAHDPHRPVAGLEGGPATVSFVRPSWVV